MSSTRCNIRDGVFYCSYAALGTGFFAAPPCVGSLSCPCKAEYLPCFTHCECCFSKYFDFIICTVRDRRPFAVLAQGRLISTSCRNISDYRQSIKKNNAFCVNVKQETVSAWRGAEGLYPREQQRTPSPMQHESNKKPRPQCCGNSSAQKGWQKRTQRYNEV